LLSREGGSKIFPLTRSADGGPGELSKKQGREMKILLVSVPLEFPLANYCLAAQLAASPETADCEIEILDLDTSRLNEYNRKNAEIWRYIAKIEATRPDVIAFSVYLWSSLSIKELVAITARVYPGITLVVGGPEVVTPGAAAAWLEGGGVTAAVRGEGEITMVELVQRLRAGDGLAGLAGCSWWDGDSVIHEAPRAPVKDLSQLASPYLTGWVPDNFFDRLVPGGKGRFPRAFLETYRGCYMQCSYCQWGNGTKLRFEFPQDRVRAELSWILSRQVSRVWIVDAMFGYKKQVAKDLLRHIIDEKRRYGARTSIVCYHNQDFYDPELFDLYREADVSVEVDLQSTDKEVLTRVGRAKWYIDSFERHLAAFREQQVPTTGAADLIIGLPGDRLETFSDSVDFLLRRGMDVNLYQTSIIPDTPMSRSVEADGVVFSDLAPRAVFKNSTFPVGEMVAARLIGHGVDFFRRYPRTAHLLWPRSYERPVDLCRHLGNLIWERYGLMYGDSHTNDAVLAEGQELVGELLDELCPQEWLRPVLHDLFRLESAISRMVIPARHATPRPVLPPFSGVYPRDSSWLAARPRFRREGVDEVRLRYRVDKVLQLWDQTGEIPGEEVWRAVEVDPKVALVFLQGAGAGTFRIVDEAITYPLLARFSGYFSIAECLDNFAPGWRALELSPVREVLSALVQAGLVEPGMPVPLAAETAERTVAV
jgi:radical SAM superfamily enzyme YgiQ (UPF0313 family)